MGQAEDIGSRDLQRISMQRSNLSRDLSQRLISRNHFPRKLEESDEGTEELELSLGLSLNGRFGIDPLRAKNLIRSSSIPDFANPGKGKDGASVVPMAFAPLIRTCSLPTETEEWRKRKELQTLRRMEAKRKRSEKQRNSKPGRDRNRDVCVEESCGEDRKLESGDGNCQKEKRVKVLNEFSCSVAPTLAVSGGGGGGFGVELNGGKGNGLDCGGREEVAQPPPLSQGSIGSQGSGSCVISEYESQQALARMSKSVDARSPPSAQSSPESEQKPPVYTGTTTVNGKSNKFAAVVTENKSNKPTDADKGAKDIVKNVLEGMPSVSTKGDGPNGKRIEGFLYGYRKGEEVRIVCVCHGNFLSPAEFVKHAGGGNVAHPLKHIVVNPTPFL